VINAGIMHSSLLSEYNDTAKMKTQLEVNLWGAILSTHTFLPLLINGSKILIMSSGFGLMGTAGYSIYCASKAGLVNFAEALRRELLYKNISVYVACPSDVKTPLHYNEQKNMPAWMKKRTIVRWPLPPDKVVKRIMRKCSGRRFIIPTHFEIHLLVFITKILPRRLRDFILDMLFPKPA
jgi:short-subunit dehydrogenase